MPAPSPPPRRRTGRQVLFRAMASLAALTAVAGCGSGDDGDDTGAPATVLPASTATSPASMPPTSTSRPATTTSARPATTTSPATTPATTPATVATTSTAPPLDQAIRRIDFRNGFTYSVPGFPVFAVSAGQSVHGTIGGPDFASFTVTDVDHGDLDGDGREDAAVSVELFTGGTGRFTNVWVYRLTATSIEQPAQTPVGDRADGGLADAGIVAGSLVVDTYDHADGACCPRAVTRRQYRLTGAALTETAAPATLALVDLRPEGATVQFLVGTSAAVLRASLDATTAAAFEAAAGQRLRAASRARADVTLTLRRGGAGGPIVTQGGPLDVALPASGPYRLEVAAAPPTGFVLVDLSIS